MIPNHYYIIKSDYYRVLYIGLYTGTTDEDNWLQFSCTIGGNPGESFNRIAGQKGDGIILFFQSWEIMKSLGPKLPDGV